MLNPFNASFRVNNTTTQAALLFLFPTKPPIAVAFSQDKQVIQTLH